MLALASTATVTYVATRPSGMSLGVPSSLIAPPTKTFMLTGILTIESDSSDVRTNDTGAADSDCQGTGGYSDLTPGTAVKVSDGAGHVIATGSITSGTAQTSYVYDHNVVTGCQLGFTVNDVPDGLPSYVLTISHRGDQYLTADRAHAPISLTIGG
ncbi:hypothetical protein [Amycolatopsis sp. M39]|uniref:hypothetical protein n=1 Tax=Amycolatopsis sp. M39 TaxID=1825094 RepID=UPI0007E288A7|nr:hypothetical protein [Amycolatopsis sp. M39]OAP26147.1 hypothetical protein A4R44_03525 [Amycolatopsis sp. M39]